MSESFRLFREKWSKTGIGYGRLEMNAKDDDINATPSIREPEEVISGTQRKVAVALNVISRGLSGR